jgi:hypothetical protein
VKGWSHLHCWPSSKLTIAPPAISDHSILMWCLKTLLKKSI